MLLSIIIPNFNYERYVGVAIASALALDYPHKEIIVVDDGSTDGSQAVIADFAKRNPGTVRAIFKRNGGQASAVNAGFVDAHGDLIYTLDSDDCVRPEMMTEVIRAWRPGVSKIQFFMEIIDVDGNFVWFNKPTIFSPEKIRASTLRTGVYPCPNTSGNVYSADYLRKVMPITPEQIWVDAYLNLLAPLYGDVIALSGPLGSYRVHDRNAQSVDALDITPPQRTHIQQTEYRDRILREHCDRLGLPVVPNIKDYDYIALSRRLVSRRLRPDLHPIENDRLVNLVIKGTKAVLANDGFRPSQKFVISTWLMVMAFGPKRLAWELARLRFLPGHRPKSLVTLLRLIGAARGTRTGDSRRPKVIAQSH